MIAIIPFILGLFLLGNALNQTSADAAMAQALSGLLFMAIGLIMAVYFRLEKRWGLTTSDQNQED